MKTEWQRIVPNNETKATDIFPGQYTILGNWPNQHILLVGWIEGCRYCAFWFGQLRDRHTNSILEGWLPSEDIESAKAEAVYSVKQWVRALAGKVEGVEP